MRLIDGDHLKSILQEYVKREKSYVELGEFPTKLIASCVISGLEEAIAQIDSEPSAQPEYKPVTVEDFAKTLSENTLYGFMAWHGEAFTLMKEMGFEICKKTM